MVSHKDLARFFNRLVQFMRFEGGSNALNPQFEMYVGRAPHGRLEHISLTPELLASCSLYLDSDHVVAMVDGAIYNTSPFLHFVRREEDVTKLCGLKRTVAGAKYEFSVFGESKSEPIPAATFDRENSDLRNLLSSQAGQGNNP